MPVVPSQKTQSVAPSPLPTPFDSGRGASAAAFGAPQAEANVQLGDAMQTVGGRLLEIATKQQIENNEREAKQLDVEFTRRLRQIGYGDGSEDNPGFYARQGQDALDAYKPTVQQIEEARQELIGSATNPRVRDMFSQASAVRQESEVNAIDKFHEKERRAANDAASQARIDEAVNNAAAAWNDPETLSTSLSVSEQEVLDTADRNGWRPAVTRRALGAARTQVLSGAVKSAFQTDPYEAQKLYEANKDRIDGAARADLEKLLEGGVLRQKSQEIVDGFFDAGLGEPQALERAREITNSKLRDEVVDRLTARFSETRRISDEQRLGQAQQLADEIASRSLNAADALSAANRIRDPKLRDAVYARLNQQYEDQHRIEARVLADQSQGDADQIIAASTDRETALARARDIDDPRLRDAVEKRINSHYDINDKIEDENLIDQSTDVADDIISGSTTEREAMDQVRQIGDAKLRAAVDQRVTRHFQQKEEIENDEVLRRSQQTADLIYDGNPENEPAALAEARQIEDDKLRKSTVDLLRSRYAEDRLAREERKAKAKAAAYKWVFEGGRMDDFASQFPDDFELVSGDGTTMTSLQNAQDRYREGQLFARTSDGTSLAALKTKSLSERAGTDLTELRATLTESEYNTAVNIVAAAQERMKDLQSDNQIYNIGEAALKDFAPRTLLPAFNGAAKATEDDVLRVQAAKADMEAYIHQYIKSYDKKPSPPEVREQARRILMPIVSDPTGLFNSFEGIAAEVENMTPAQIAVAKVPRDSIPLQLQSEILSFVEQAGREPTPLLIENLAGAIITNNRARFRTLLGME